MEFSKQNRSELKKKRLIERTNYFIVLLALFAVSPFFSLIPNYFLLGLLVFVFLIHAKRKGKFIDYDIFRVLLVVYVIIVIQSALYGGFTFAALYLPLTIFYLPYLLFRMMREKFFYYFIRIMYVVALFTLPLWLLQSFVPAIDQLLRKLIILILPYSWSAVPRSLLVYTAAWGDEVFNQSLGIYRNSGIFHEPGAYGVFLTFAIILNYFFTGKMFEKKNLVFLLCMLTTLSTTGYFVLFVIFVFYLLKLKINLGLKFIGVLIFIFASLQIYRSEDFLKEKVESQYEEQTYNASNNLGRFEGHSGRFYAFITSVKLFMNHPVFGRGIIYGTSEKASGEMHKEGSYGYGFIGVLSTYGAFFGLYYLFTLFNGLRQLSKISNQTLFFTIGMFIAINLSLLTQTFVLSSCFVNLFIFGLRKRQILSSVNNNA